MKLEMVKRILATGLCVTMLVGNHLTIFAEETVSGNDAESVEIIEELSEEETQTEDVQAEETSEAGVQEEASEEESDEVEINEEETVSGGDLPEENIVEIEDEDVALADSIVVDLEPVTLDGVTVIVSGPEAAFAEGTTVSVVELEPTKMIIDAIESEEQAVVKLCRVFEVKLMCDGKEVEPLNGAEVDVKFEGDLFISDEQNVSLYQVEGESNLTKVDMNGAKTEE